MKIEWKSIRNQLEKEYGEKKFECIYDDKYKSSCICIPGVAINYVANELKKDKKCTIDGEMKWNNTLNRYLFQGICGERIPNLQSDNEGGIMLIPKESLCNPKDSEYAYIRIRKAEEIRNENEDIDINYYINSLEDVNHFKWYSAYTKEYRMNYEMPEYIDRLFRLFFFLNPFLGRKVIEKEFQKYSEDKEFLEYNYKVLNDYEEMAKVLEKKDSMVYIMKKISEFVGSDLIVLYIYFNDANDYGDIRGINELLLKCVNSAKECIGKEKMTSLQKLKRNIKKQKSALTLAKSS